LTHRRLSAGTLYNLVIRFTPFSVRSPSARSVLTKSRTKRHENAFDRAGGRAINFTGTHF
jgi:hypothetical protein